MYVICTVAKLIFAFKDIEGHETSFGENIAKTNQTSPENIKFKPSNVLSYKWIIAHLKNEPAAH